MKRIYFFVVILILSITTWAQSSQSDSLFAAGVDYYHQGKYNEAIAVFKLSNELDHKELDSLSPRRDYSSQWLASCYYKLGNDKEARKLNPGYKSEPVDRRLTVVSDSLCSEVLHKIQKKRFYAAIKDLQEVSRIEHQICDSNNYCHYGTYMVEAQCYMAVQNANAALKCANEAYRLEEVNYEEYDTLFLNTLDVIYTLHFNLMNFDKARFYNNKAFEIIKLRCDSRHIGNVICKLRNIELDLVDMNWDKAHEALPDYLETIDRCTENNYSLQLQFLMGIRSDFEMCSRTEDLKTINKAITACSKKSDKGNEIWSKLLQYSGALGQGDIKTAKKMKKEVDKELKKYPENSYKEQRACSLCMNSIYYMLTDDKETGYELFDKLHNDSLDRYLNKDTPFYVMYTCTKAAVCMAKEDYDCAIDAYSEAIGAMKPEDLVRNPSYYTTLIYLNVFAEKYKNALDITKKSIENYEVVVNSGGFRMEKDTAEVRKVINNMQSYLEDSYFMADSVRYAYREIKCQYVRLMTRLLKNDPSYLNNYNYLPTIINLANDLLIIQKYIEAQELIDEYMAEIKGKRDEIDVLLFERKFETALEFKRKCYEKGDPEGARAYLDYADYVRTVCHNDTRQYEQAMYDYYVYTDNKQEIANCLLKKIHSPNTYIDSETYETLIEVLDNNYELKQQYLKDYLNYSIERHYNRGDCYKILNISNKIKDNYYDRQDTTELYSFYRDELWPSFDKLGDDYLYCFFKSVYALKYKEKGTGFINCINSELSRRSDVFSDPIIMACVEHAIAGVLMHGNKKELASEYMERAYNRIGKDDVLKTLFACSLYETRHKTYYSYYSFDDNDRIENDSLLRWGNEILDAVDKVPYLKNTIEISDLVEKQFNLLPYTSQPTMFIDYYKSLLEYYINIDKDNIKEMFNSDYKNYDKLKFLSDAPLPGSSFLLWKRDLNDEMFQLRYIYPEEAGNFALSKINDEYKSLSTSMYLNSVDTYELDDLINKSSKYAYQYQTDSLRIYAYNTALYCKGLQLRSEYAIHDMIKQSGHISALRKYEELKYTQNLMVGAKGKELDSLKKKADDLENALHKLSKLFGDYKKSLSTSWEDVRNSLDENDIAIEFTYVKSDYHDYYINSYGKLVDDDMIKEGYYACLVKKNMQLPEVIFIADKDSITNTADVYTNVSMTRRIMNPLKEYISDEKNIYFSPIGIFNQLAIESLMLEEDSTKTLSNKYNMYRVSSTRELVNKNLYIKGRDAIVYGGLLYNTSIESMEEDAKKYPKMNKDRDIAITNIDDIRANIKGIKYLEGTKKEAEYITHTIESANDSLLSVHPYIGAEGTEASFKALNEKRKRIIHIATHGFYYSEEDIKNAQITEENKLSSEDKALLRSGLFFAGAKNKIVGNEIPDGVDDGILLAQEIANTDLSGLDIVVLSACQTAQGYVSSEGVFGLQRGFKSQQHTHVIMESG